MQRNRLPAIRQTPDYQRGNGKQQAEQETRGGPLEDELATSLMTGIPSAGGWIC